MRAALIPLRTHVKKPDLNWQRFVHVAREVVARERVGLICLPECTFTGYLYEPDDLARFSETIPGPTTDKVALLARQLQTSICFGLAERTPNGVFNSAVLMSSDGTIRLLHRKVAEKPPYARGSRVEAANTEFGKVALLICGDLFQEEAIQQVPPDTQWLMVPMARGFDGRSPDRRRWEEEERQVYQKAIERIGVHAMIVNALDVGIEEGSFGGGMVVDEAGKVLAESPHGTDEPLVFDLVCSGTPQTA